MMLKTLFVIVIQLFSLKCVYCCNHEPKFVSGRTTIVHLFEWKWNEIAEECETFLGPYGYGGVQISPPNENGIIWEPSWKPEVRRPWYERYQPVSYKIATRSGNETEFRDMVKRCNDVEVRIYVDTIINHMTGDIGAGQGTGGSNFDPTVPRYDGVPYGPEHFTTSQNTSKDNCPTESGNIEDYNNKEQVRNCKLSGLNDLDQSQEYVRNKIKEFMNQLISIGVAGFRIDAAKHMWPEHLSAIYSGLNDLNETFFPPNTKPFIYQEVIDLGGEAIKSDEYAAFGRVTEFRYGKQLGNRGNRHQHKKSCNELKKKKRNLFITMCGFFLLLCNTDQLQSIAEQFLDDDNNGSTDILIYDMHILFGDVIRKNNNQLLRYLRNFGEGWDFISGSNALTFVDNHDNQRGHGAGGYGSILTHRQPKMYKMAIAFMLAWPYGLPRVMSSYSWNEQIVDGKDVNDWIGPPSDSDWNIKDVKRNSNLSCGDGWICEHRWPQIYNMVKFRNVAESSTVNNWWDNGYHQIAFSRGDKGFIAINNDNSTLNENLQTGLPEGTYCDVISGNKEKDRCTGGSIQVNKSGYAQIFVNNTSNCPMIAIHVQAKL